MAKKCSEPSCCAKKVRLAFIGSGGIMNWHVDRLKGTPSEFVALMDTSKEALAKLKGKQPQLKDVP